MELRNTRRVVFEQGQPAHIMGIDGTSRLPCTIEDTSETGAKLRVEGATEGHALKEFFLLLSSTGLAFRHCELVWVNGETLGVSFKRADKKNQRK